MSLNPKPTPSAGIVVILIAITIVFTSAGILSARADSVNSATHYLSQSSHQPDGNRLVYGAVDLQQLNAIDIPLAESPSWLVGAPFENGVLWVAVHPSGLVEAIKTAGTSWKRVAISPTRLPPGMPPLLRIRNDEAELITPGKDASPHTHATLLGQTKALVYIDLKGNLRVESGGSKVSLPINALPDSRIVSDRQNRAAILTGPTDRYPHGVLGDQIEASAITLVSIYPTPKVLRVINIPSPWVIEGIAPIWSDLNGDGQRELIVTLSSETNGGKIVVFNEAGIQIAEGPGIGRGLRWRNQMAVAPYGPEKELELSAVLTPHIGGTVEFYQLKGNRLEIVASVPGFTSHVIRSRNLDLNISGQFLGTDQSTLLVPNNQRTSLSAIRRTPEGADIAYSLNIGSHLSSNPAAVSLPGGAITVGIGRQDATLRIWTDPSVGTKLSYKQTEHPSQQLLTLYGVGGRTYALEKTTDLLNWKRHRVVSIPESSDRIQVELSMSDAPQSFYRAESLTESPEADILSAQTSGEEGKYQFTVKILSPDTGCEQYANWWEILSEDGALLYRRILLHSHENEQPFTRSGGPVFISATDTVWIRAHMKHSGYGGTVLRGSVSSGFTQTTPPKNFALDVANTPPFPLTEDCDP